MNCTGVFISAATLNSASPALRSKILELIMGAETAVPSSSSDSGIHDDNFVEFSPGQIKTFIDGCSDKTRAALEVMARSPSRQFQLADVASALNVEPSELRGVWGGLTRRTQTVSGDPNAYLIYWAGDPVYNENEEYVDHVGELTEMTYQSLRKAFRL